MRKRLLLLSGMIISGFGVGLASTTQIWKQDTASDFEQGTPTNISIRSDGYLQLAPRQRQVYQSRDAFFWAAAEDSRGRLFIGSGNEGKVYIYENGEGRLFFDAPEMEIHALTVDGQDNLFVGTSPDGKIYRLAPDGTSQVFYEPGVKYIWALVVDKRDHLYAGTGEEGKIFRIEGPGRGTVLFDSQDKHIRTLALDGQGNLIAGSESQAHIFRITPAGRPFILYDPPLREITSILIAENGTIYAAGIGKQEEKGGAASSLSAGMTSASVVLTPTAASGATALATQNMTGQTGTSAAATKTKTPGSRLFRITPDGFPQQIWKSDKTTIYSLAFSSDGSLLAGTGDKGFIYRIDADGRHSSILGQTEPSQITALLGARNKPLVYAITSNLTKVYALESEYVQQGTFISQVKDTVTFSNWGRVSWRQNVPGGASVRLYTRSGNTKEPDNTWSDWSEPITRARGETVTSPPARFIQWKLVFSNGTGGKTPLVDNVELSYLPRNVAPVIVAVALQPPDVAFEKAPDYGAQQVFTTTTGATNGGGASTQSQINRARRRQQTLQKLPPRQRVREGYRTVTWSVSDVNDDDVVYSIYIRGEEETEWKLLKEKIRDTFYAWDTRQFPDGYYALKLVASDEPSNPPDRAGVVEKITEWFEIDNTAPRIEELSVRSLPEGGVRVRFRARDSATPIADADYLVDNTDRKMVISTDGILDAEEESFDFVINGLKSGEHTITVRVRDGADNLASARAVMRVE